MHLIIDEKQVIIMLKLKKLIQIIFFYGESNLGFNIRKTKELKFKLKIK